MANALHFFCGAGCAGAHDEVVELATKLQAPVVHAFRGKEWVEWDNPYDVGMTGLLGYTSGYRAIEQCDTLIMLGTDFPYRPFYPENAKVIQVDINPSALGARVPLTQGIIGSVKIPYTNYFLILHNVMIQNSSIPFVKHTLNSAMI